MKSRWERFDDWWDEYQQSYDGDTWKYQRQKIQEIFDSSLRGKKINWHTVWSVFGKFWCQQEWKIQRNKIEELTYKYRK